MGDCELVIENLYDYITSHDMTPETCAEIKQHLEACRRCFDRVEFEVKIVERFKSSGDCKCPDSLKRKVQALIDRF